ncbi:SDR family oxidoreductase [Allorhizocola rhizosphaerae]|uniref:SDR family oxidoreductase n=1 Tax=Allorhizocola rhizosphaerae TaxID=1872709 RepID=UPI000E3C661E|nr:SDR family oxidoreductase [Allorhizocola rhizosphaerae]
MRVEGKRIVITGAAAGIGEALARRFRAEGAAHLVLADLEAPVALASELDAEAVACDVGSSEQVESLVATAGEVDLFCANAGVAFGSGIDAPDSDWALAWSVNVMAHVYSARAVLPDMLARGSGYLLHTCSAAGLLTSLGDAPYTVSKHAAVGFAEWLAATYGDRGIRVSALCPQGVRTRMLMQGLERNDPAALAVATAGTIIEPSDVADAVIEGLAAERFLILPHPEVATFQQRKATDPDRWLAGVRRLASR